MRPPVNGHLTDEEMLDAVEGRPSSRVTEHLEACSACRSLHQRVSAVLGALRFEPEPSLSDALRDRLMAHHARVHRARPMILRLMAYRIPLYQVAVAAAAILIFWQVASHPQSEARTGVLPPFVTAASDLWTGAVGIALPSLSASDDSNAVKVAIRPERPPLELPSDIGFSPRRSAPADAAPSSEGAGNRP